VQLGSWTHSSRTPSKPTAQAALKLRPEGQLPIAPPRGSDRLQLQSMVSPCLLFPFPLPFFIVPSKPGRGILLDLTHVGARGLLAAADRVRRAFV